MFKIFGRRATTRERGDENETAPSPRVIRSIRDLPEAFDLQKYDQLKSFDLVQWARQITPRVMTHVMLTKLISAREPSRTPDFDEYLRTRRDEFADYARTLIERPIVPPLAGDRKDEHIDVWRSRLESKPFDTYTVHAMEGSWACGLVEEIKSGNPIWEPIISATAAMSNGKATPTEQEIAATPVDVVYRDSGLNNAGWTHVVVDLAATDDQIIADFRRFLPSYRKLLGIQVRAQGVTEKDFATWISAGVIPYIDLQLWSLAENCSITQNILGQAIFPDEYETDTTERIRRTTRPKADQILTSEFEAALAMQVAAHLLAKKNPA